MRIAAQLCAASAQEEARRRIRPKNGCWSDVCRTSCKSNRKTLTQSDFNSIAWGATGDQTWTTDELALPASRSFSIFSDDKIGARVQSQFPLLLKITRHGHSHARQPAQPARRKTRQY